MSARRARADSVRKPPRRKYGQGQIKIAMHLRAAGLDWQAIARRLGSVSGPAMRSAVYRYSGELPAEMRGMGWALVTQDWRGHRFGRPEPRPAVEVFQTRDEAMAAKAAAPRIEGVLYAVVNLSPRTARAA